MGPALNVSLSGFNAATTRLENAVTNIANQESTRTQGDTDAAPQSFLPQDVVQTSLESGGVQTELRPRENPTIRVPNNDGSGETTEAPNVNTAEELVEAKIATYDAKANLAAIRIEDKLLKNTVDLIA